MIATCSIEGCQRKHYAKGWCEAHHGRWRRAGTPAGTGIPLKPRRGEPLAWLEAHSNYSGAECLPWPYGKLVGGYGTIMIDGHRTTAHRHMCRLAHGEPPADDMEAAHSCAQNRACVHPQHLRWATRAQNASDRLQHGTDARGERNYATQVTSEQVLQIVEALRSKSAAAVAKEFGVSKSTISSIRHGCSWSWLTGIHRDTRKAA